MKNKDINTWVKALRSGDYKQGRYRLCQGRGDECLYCCLGVMIEELIEDDWELDRSGSWVIDDKTALPSDNILNKIGMSHSTMSLMADLNDRKLLSFEEIADFIEDHRTELVKGKHIER